MFVHQLKDNCNGSGGEYAENKVDHGANVNENDCNNKKSLAVLISFLDE